MPTLRDLSRNAVGSGPADHPNQADALSNRGGAKISLRETPCSSISRKRRLANFGCRNSLTSLTSLTSQGRMTHLVEDLAKAGLVARTRDPEDGLGIDVQVTEAGLYRLRGAYPVHLARVPSIMDQVEPQASSGFGRPHRRDCQREREVATTPLAPGQSLGTTHVASVSNGPAASLTHSTPRPYLAIFLRSIPCPPRQASL